MTGVDQAFYLVHSMVRGTRFAALDREAAANFGRSGVRRLIYLGGLADDEDFLLALESRVETGEALRDSARFPSCFAGRLGVDALPSPACLTETY